MDNMTSQEFKLWNWILEQRAKPQAVKTYWFPRIVPVTISVNMFTKKCEELNICPEHGLVKLHRLGIIADHEYLVGSLIIQ